MRTPTFRWVVSVASAMVLGSVAGAQSSEPACSMGFANILGIGMGGSGSTPYTVTAKTTFAKKLPDGSYIRGYMVSHQARDAAGRTMWEQPIGCWRDENGVPQPWMTIRIFDPNGKIQLSWNINGPNADKTAHVFHQVPPKPLTAEEQAARKKRMQVHQTPPGEFKTEDLGVRTIAGVEAYGKRMTRTIPAGEEGNELPLETVDETWYAKDLGLDVMAVKDDPRIGRSTFEIEELTVGEPDASLFAPPAGYKIVDPNPPADSATKP